MVILLLVLANLTPEKAELLLFNNAGNWRVLAVPLALMQKIINISCR